MAHVEVEKLDNIGETTTNDHTGTIEDYTMNFEDVSNSQQ